MGFLNTIYTNLDLMVMFDITWTKEQETLSKIRKEKGLRATLDWRDAWFKEDE